VQRKLSKGFVFTFEAILTILIFILLLYSLPQEKTPTFKELIITQQANDLLRVWSQECLAEEEIMRDAKQLFKNQVSLWINEKELTKCNAKNTIATEGIILDQHLKENKIKIIICYN
jgi:hypothetical protein